MIWRARYALPPISSDAFTGFGVIEDNEEAQSALRHYFDDYLPQVVQLLPADADHDWTKDVSGTWLTHLLHEHGINLRHLGHVLNLVSACETQDAIKAALRSLTLREMTVRALKSVVLRELRSDGTVPVEEVLKSVGADKALSALVFKYPEAKLSGEDERYVTQTLLDAAACSEPLSVWSEVRDATTGIVSDVLTTPDFPSVEQAEQRLLSELEVRAQTLGDDSPNLLSTMGLLLRLYQSWHADNAADTQLKASALIARMIAIAKTDEAQFSWVYNDCAWYWYGAGRVKKALPLYKRSLRVKKAVYGKRHPLVLMTLSNIAMCYNDQALYEKAQPLLERVLRLREETLGSRHPEVAFAMDKLATLYSDQAEWHKDPELLKKSRSLYERALNLMQDVLGKEHPEVASTMHNLATLYCQQGLYNRAKPLYETALRLHEKNLGELHPHFAATCENLAILHKREGRLDEALPLYLRALKAREESLDPDHPAVAISCNNLGCLYMDQGRLRQAKELLNRALLIWSGSKPAGHPDLVKLKRNLWRLDATLAGKDVSWTRNLPFGL